MLRSLRLGGWSDLAEEIESTLDAAAADGGEMALADIGAVDSEMFGQVNEAAAEYARDRGAEMVGMKWVDGELVENPDARWAITESTRDGLRDLVTSAFEDGLSPAQLADKVESSYLFSEARAEMIGRTEIAKAHVSGMLEGWKASGLVEGKRSILGSEHEADGIEDECDDNADAGVIGLDEEFPSGDTESPFHPNCVCSLIAELKKDEE